MNYSVKNFQLWLQIGKGTLDTSDRMCLVEGRELCDEHVNLLKEFSGTGITGLYSTIKPKLRLVIWTYGISHTKRYGGLYGMLFVIVLYCHVISLERHVHQILLQSLNVTF